MRLLYCFALVGLLTGQAQTAPTLPVTQANPGPVRYWPPSTPPFVVNVSLAGSSGQNIAAVEFSLALPAGAVVPFQACPAVAGVTPTPTNCIAAGAASTAAGKSSVSCAPVTAGGLLTCLSWGPNANVYSDGIVALVPVSLPTSSAPGSISLVASNISAASAAGAGLTVAAGPVLSVMVLNPCDINSDGALNAADINPALAQALGFATCGTADLIGTGTCTGMNGVVDVVRVINAAALGNACKVGP